MCAVEYLKLLKSSLTYTGLNTVVMPGDTEPRRTQAHPSPKTSGQPMKSRYQLSQSGVVPLYLSRGSGGDRIRGWTKSDEDPRAKIGHTGGSFRGFHQGCYEATTPRGRGRGRGHNPRGRGRGRGHNPRGRGRGHNPRGRGRGRGQDPSIEILIIITVSN